MNLESDFQKQMVEYFESTHIGEFITGGLEDVKQNVDLAELDDDYKNPTETLSIQPTFQDCIFTQLGSCY